jgi:hypothetical protein
VGRASELRRLIALAEQLRGPVAQQVQNAVARRTDPAHQLERRRARLARRRAWASRWLVAWTLLTAICMLVVVTSFTGDETRSDTGLGFLMVSLITGTFAVRSGLRMRRLAGEQRALDASPASPQPAALPPKGSLARQPMERLAEAEQTLAELLHQIARGGSVPADSVEHTRRTGAEAATVLRRVAAQLNAVERARDHAPPLERGPLADGVRRLRTQLDEGLDGYGSLVAAAGRVLAASTLAGPTQELTEATDHLAGLALALRDLSPDP